MATETVNQPATPMSKRLVRRLVAQADSQNQADDCPARQQRQQDETAPDHTPACSHNQVVVVDDDPACRALVGHLLRKQGYDVQAFCDGPEALTFLEQATPGLILLDLDMPEMTGYEVCDRIKHADRFEHLPVIFLTAASDPQDKERGFAVGGADFVTKPIEKVELLARIRYHMSSAVDQWHLNRRALLLEEVAAEQLSRLDQVRIGQELLLTSPESLPELKLAVRLKAANEAGGDFYEIARLSEQSYGFFVADVSGHDLSVPFITGALKALTALCLNDAMEPAEAMAVINTGLRKTLNPERFVSSCYAKFHPDLMELQIVNAGHPPGLLRRRDGTTDYIQSIGDVLGMFEDVRFETKRVEVEPGDRLILYTDGLIEGYRDAKGRTGRPMFGMGELERRVAAMRPMPVDDMVNQLLQDLLAESDLAVKDDVVIMAVEF